MHKKHWRSQWHPITGSASALLFDRYERETTEGEMTMRLAKVLIVFSLLVIVSSATAEDKPAPSPGPPPTFVRVLQVNQPQGELVLVNRTVRFVSEAITAHAPRNRKDEPVMRTTYMPV